MTSKRPNPDRPSLTLYGARASGSVAVWSEQLVVNAPSNRISADRDTVLNLMRQGLIHYSSFERRIERLRVDGDIAIVMGAETIMPVGNSPQAGQTVQRRFTHVWKKEAGAWRLVVRHANVIASERGVPR